MSDEESPKKKEKDFLGIPASDTGTYGLVLGGLGLLVGLGALAYPFIKPQIDRAQADMQNRQAYLQQQQMLAAQAQQAQAQQQMPYQQGQYSEANQAPPVQQEPQQISEESQYAVEQDPFSKPRRARIPEIEASEASGTGRFNNISV